MKNLKIKSDKKILSISLSFKRYLHAKINFSNRLIGITGARGTGKSTLVLQHIKLNYTNLDEVLYVSMDDIYFITNSLSDLAEQFLVEGGKILILDEVHKYPLWSREVKNIYDFHPELQIIYTGSSLPEIYKAEADLSRRAVTYNLHELSFRESVELVTGICLPLVSLTDVLTNHTEIAREISKDTKPVKLFHDYLKTGVYPFIVEGKEEYQDKLIRTLWQVLEVDLPGIIPVEYGTIIKLKKLLYFIGSSVPYTPNIKELSEKVGASRDQILRFIDLLEKAKVLFSIRPKSGPTGYMTKPEKIYLHNSSLIYSIDEENANIGTARETFFANQLSLEHKVYYSDKGDFLIDGKYIFEIGGKNKSGKQIKTVANSFVAADNIESGYKNTIPLWMFGLVY